MQTEKLYLLKKIIETPDKGILDRIKAIFDQEPDGDIWDEMPDEVKYSVERGLNQSEVGESVPHEEVVKD
ncbi:MAG: hypothetical protein ACYC1Q_08685 [Bacteroidia bacterium]